VETSLKPVVSLSAMSPRSSDDEIENSALGATPNRGEAAALSPLGRHGTCRLPRVRAFMRVTRRAEGSTRCRSEQTGGSPRLSTHVGGCEPCAPWFDAGGPGPLTKDRQSHDVGYRECTERVTPCLLLLLAPPNSAFHCGGPSGLRSRAR
jgi:hypothetical protein